MHACILSAWIITAGHIYKRKFQVTGAILSSGVVKTGAKLPRCLRINAKSKTGALRKAKEAVAEDSGRAFKHMYISDCILFFCCFSVNFQRCEDSCAESAAAQFGSAANHQKLLFCRWSIVYCDRYFALL